MGTRAVETDQGPDYAAVLGLETGPSAGVPVILPEPVRVRQEPTVGGTMVTVNLTASNPVAVKILNPNPMRTHVQLVSPGEFFVGFGKSEAEAGNGRVPAALRVELHGGHGLWVRCGAADTYVTAICEHGEH
jgi:hypothetical protein